MIRIHVILKVTEMQSVAGSADTFVIAVINLCAPASSLGQEGLMGFVYD
jgi:hypothetical protein